MIRDRAELRMVALLAVALAAMGQQRQLAPPPGFGPRLDMPKPKPEEPKAPAQQRQQPPGPVVPAQQPPQQQTPAPAKPAEGAPAPEAPPPAASTGGLNLSNASLTEVIDILARQLKINYIIDPRVKGAVTINTYGELKSIDTRSLLELILRINGAAMVQVGDIWRIVPLTDVLRLPVQPEINARPERSDDSVMLNLVFLKYATVDELAKLLDPFIGEGGKTIAYAPANLLLIQDSRRNMRRLMDLIGLFDSDTFASQRVKLFEIKESRPADIAKELEGILKSISLSEKTTPVKLLPIDRINTLVAVAPNPGVFDEVEKWIKKLDIPMTVATGGIENRVYRVKYGRAETLAMAIMSLYGGWGFGMMGMMGMMGGMGGYGMGGYGMGGYGGMGGGYGMGGGGYPGMGMPGMYGGGYPGVGYPGAGYPAFTPQYQPAPGQLGGGAAPVPQGSVTVAPGTTDQTGQYLAPGTAGQTGRIPRVVPNPLDNTLLIQATAQEYAGILKLLRDLDVPPRQVLIEAKIYEVDLTGAFASGVAAYFQKRNAGSVSLPDKSITASVAEGSLNLSVGALVGRSRELLAFLSAQEATTRARVISAPSVIATDSIPASINVGTEVPTLTAQAVTGVQQSGNSLFAQNISNRNSGVTMNIMARVNPSGIVTLVINQEVSAPQAPAASAAIQSPSFSKRSVSTQITLQDGDTIAIGGIINESNTSSSAGVPFLHRIPVLGAAFGSRSYSRERTELIIFMTPRVIYDMNELQEASEELKSRLKRLSKIIKDE